MGCFEYALHSLLKCFLDLVPKSHSRTWIITTRGTLGVVGRDSSCIIPHQKSHANRLEADKSGLLATPCVAVTPQMPEQVIAGIEGSATI